MAELFSQLPFFHLWSDAHVGAQPANLYLLIKGKFTRSPATSIFFDRKQEMKKHYQIRQHKHKSLLLRDFQFQLACSYLIWFIAVDDQHKEPMMYVYKDHLDGKLTTLYICIKNKQESESGWWEQANYKCGRNFSFQISRSFKKQHNWKLVFSSIKFVSTSPRVVPSQVPTIWEVRIPNPLASVKSKRTLPTTCVTRFGTYKAKQWPELDPLVESGAKYVDVAM